MVNWTKLIATLMVTVAVSAGVVQAQTKITAYGYPGDSTPDSNSSNGIGNHDNQLTPFQGAGGVSDAALTATAAREYGVSIGQRFTVTGANGSTYTLRYEDTAPESDSRIDIYDSNQLLTGGNDNSFSTNVTSFNDGPAVNSGSNPVGGTTTAQSGTSNMQTPFEQVFGSAQAFVNQPAPQAVSLLCTIIAFVCLLWSIAASFYSSPDEDWRPKVMAFIRAAVVSAFIANCGQVINTIEEAVDQVYNGNGMAGQEMPQILDDIRTNNPAATSYSKAGKPSSFDMWGNINAAINNFCYGVGVALTMAIWATVWVFRFLQGMFIVLLYIILPLAFGLAVTPWFASVGASIISSLLGVLFWPVGFLLVDTFIVSILKVVLRGLNGWGQPIPAGGGVDSVFWFMSAQNAVGFGLTLLVMGLVLLPLTIVGYFAAAKIITSLFGSAGGLISGGIGALGKIVALAVAGAGVAAGAAVYGAGSAVSAIGSAGAAAEAGKAAASATANEAASGSPGVVPGLNGSGGNASVLSDNGGVDGLVDGVTAAVESNATRNGSSQSPSQQAQPSTSSLSQNNGTADAVADSVTSAVGGVNNSRRRGLGSVASSTPGSTPLRGANTVLGQRGSNGASVRVPGAAAIVGGDRQSIVPGVGGGDNAQEGSDPGSDGVAAGAENTKRSGVLRRSLASMGAGMKEAGVVIMAGSASRTMRQAMKNSLAHAIVDGKKPTSRRRSLDEIDEANAQQQRAREKETEEA